MKRDYYTKGQWTVSKNYYKSLTDFEKLALEKADFLCENFVTLRGMKEHLMAVANSCGIKQTCEVSVKPASFYAGEARIVASYSLNIRHFNKSMPSLRISSPIVKVNEDAGIYC